MFELVFLFAVLILVFGYVVWVSRNQIKWYQNRYENLLHYAFAKIKHRESEDGYEELMGSELKEFEEEVEKWLLKKGYETSEEQAKHPRK